MSILAALGIAGASAGLQFLGGSMSNSASAEEAHKNRLHQIRMAKNRYQWEVEDLRKAGINPIYSVQGGSPPGIGSGAMPHFTNPVPDSSSSFLNAASILNRIRIDRDVADSQIALNKANALNSAANAAAQLSRNPFESDMSYARLLTEKARSHNLSMDSMNKLRQYEQDWQYLERKMQLQNAKDALELKILKNSVDSLKNPKWNKGVGYGKDALDLIGGAVSSATGVSKIANILKNVARRR